MSDMPRPDRPRPVTSEPFKRYDPAHDPIEYRHVDPCTGLIVPDRKA